VTTFVCLRLLVHRILYCVCVWFEQKGDRLDSREQACMGACQDRYLETRTHVQEALQKRQGDM
jgi:hypothetical protein